MNNRKVKVHDGNGIFRQEEWRNLKVGDIVRVEKDEFFPADLLILSSSYEDSICYVETMNLDGETNLKVKQGLEATSSALHEDSDFKELKAVVRCEDPNADLYTFVGTLELEEQRLPLSIQQLLLRDSKLRNTEYEHRVRSAFQLDEVQRENRDGAKPSGMRCFKKVNHGRYVVNVVNTEEETKLKGNLVLV